MANILVVSECSKGALKKATLSAVTFASDVAKATGGTFSMLLIGAGVEAAADAAASFGAAKVLVADDASLENYLAETYTPTVAAVAAGFDIICGCATAYGKDLLARVAGKLEAGYAADITSAAVDGGTVVYKRPMFAGNAFGHCKINSAKQVVSIRQSAYSPAVAADGKSAVEKVGVEAASAAAARINVVGFDEVKSTRPELTEANVVISGGRAIKEQFYDILDPLADVLGAAIGASRAACDAGYCAPDLQVGQTGKVVAPDLYFAIGISGAIQHLAGMKSSKVIVSINKDAEAPIYSITDYGLVADLFKVVPELVTAIKAAKA